MHVGHVDAGSSATIWANTVSMPLALRREPGGDHHAAVRLDVDVPALVGADPRALDVAGQADAEPPSLAAGCGLLGGERVPADHLLEPLERGRVLARVVDERPPVLERHVEVVGELVGLDEVAGPDVGAVEAEVLGDAVDGALITKHPCGRPRPGRGDGHRVGVERGERGAR